MSNSAGKPTYLANTFLYTLMPFLRGLVNFIMLPVLTRFISPADYGVLSLTVGLSTFSWMFYLGLNNASFRLYFKYKDDIVSLRRLLSTNFVFIAFAFVVYSLLLITFFPAVNAYFFKGRLPLYWALLAVLQFTLVYVNTISQDILRIQHRGKNWFFNEVISCVLMAVLCLWLVSARIFTFEAVIAANLAAEAVKWVLNYSQLREFYVLDFRFSFLRRSLAYSWPQTPAALVAFIYSYVDKVLLGRLKGLAQLGILEVCGKVSLTLKANMDGISGVFSPVSLELLTEGTSAALHKLARACHLVVFFVLFISAAIILFSKELILLLTAPQYHFAIYVAPVYIYYHIFGLLGMLSYWLIYFHPEKTFWQLPINIFGLISNTAANLILIPRFGIMGAAFAVFLSCGLTQAIQFFVGLKITPIPLSRFKILIMFLAVFGITALLYLIYYLKFGLWEGVAAKSCLLFLFVILGLGLKVFDFGLIKEITSALLNSIRLKETQAA